MTSSFLKNSGFRCLECNLADNNVLTPEKMKCEMCCPFKHKNVYKTCVKCINPNCTDAGGLRLHFTPLNNLKTYFHIEPSKRLAPNSKDINWISLSQVRIEPGYEMNEFDYTLKNEGANQMVLWIIPNKNMKNQNLTIRITDITNIYDLEGNRMHIKESHYPLKFVDWYSKIQNLIVIVLYHVSMLTPITDSCEVLLYIHYRRIHLWSNERNN